MDLDLAGKVALVSGASRGIGAGIAAALAREGIDLVLTARAEAALAAQAERVTAAHGVRTHTVSADLRERDAPAKVVDAAIAAFARLDVLVNCAGATKRGDFFELTDDEFEDGFELKFHGCVRLCRSAWPHLKRAAGAIVNIAGIGARTPSADFTIGGPVNSAMLNFSKALADIGRADGVRVNVINPGLIATERLERRLADVSAREGITRDEAAGRVLSGVGVARFGTPADIGDLVAFLASARASYIHGSTIDIDGGATRGLF